MEEPAIASAALASAVDSGRGLSEVQYSHVIAVAAGISAGDAVAQQQLDQLNAGAAAGAPRVVVLPAGGGGVATSPSLIEQHLIAPGRRGVLVVEYVAEEEGAQRKRRRAAGNAVAEAGAKYEGGGYSGRCVPLCLSCSCGTPAALAPSVPAPNARAPPDAPCRVNFQPGGRETVPLVGKRSASWTRRLAEAVTHRVRAPGSHCAWAGDRPRHHLSL